MLNARSNQISIKLTVLYTIFALNMVFHLFCSIFLMYVSFSLAVYEGTVRSSFSVLLFIIYLFNHFCPFNA